MTTTGFYRTDQAMAARAAEILLPAVDAEARGRYRQIPITLRTTGLAATYALIAARSGAPGTAGQLYASLADGITSYLRDEHLIPAARQQPDRRQTIKAIAAMDVSAYALASAGVAAMTSWLARLAQALHDERIDQ